MEKYTEKNKKKEINQNEQNNIRPLYKMFMDENKNNKKKLHLIRSNNNYSKIYKYHGKNCEGDKYFQNTNINFQLFSYKILEAKHNSTPEIYQSNIINILIQKRKCHLFAYFNEISLNSYTLKDFLKRKYSFQEIKVRIPKYASYYKNYLNFFCRPYFINYSINKKMIKHMESVAQIFYDKNYAEEDKQKEINTKIETKKDIQIFSKKISEEIENCNVFTKVNSETEMKRIQLINQNIKSNNEANKFKYNLNLSEIGQSSIINNSNIIINNITNYSLKNKSNEKINENEVDKDINNIQTNRSISLLIEQLENKNKELENKNNINKNYIIIKEGKLENNIDININHFIIENNINKNKNNFNKNINKNIISKNKDNDELINLSKKISNKIIINYMEKAPENNLKNIEKEIIRNKKSVLALPHSTKIRFSNSIKNFRKISPNTMKNNFNYNLSKPLKESRNKSVFRGGYNSGSITNVHKYKNNDIAKNKQKLEKISLYTNHTNKLKNMLNNISYGTIKMKKNNIIYNKKIGILNREKEKLRSISNMQQRPKKIFSSILEFNGGKFHLKHFNNNNDNKKILENNNIISPISKDTYIKEIISQKRKNSTNKNNDKILKIKDLKLKKRNLDFNKLLNIHQNIKRNKSTGK